MCGSHDIRTAKASEVHNLAIQDGIFLRDDGKVDGQVGGKIEMRRMQVVRLMLAAGADINASASVAAIRENGVWRRFMMSPLSLAVIKRLPTVCRFLLDKGAKLTGDEEGLGIHFNHLRLFLFRTGSFARSSAMNEILEIIVEKSDEDTVREIVEASKQSTGVLFPATQGHDFRNDLYRDIKGHQKALCIALERTDWKRTSFYPEDSVFFAFHGRDEQPVIELAIKHGLRSKSSCNFLSLAYSLNESGVARLPHPSKINTELQDRDGFTATHLAASYIDLRLLQILVNHGTDLNIKARNGKTPLYLAVQNSLIQNVELLVQNGAKAFMADPDNSNPIHVSLINDFYDVFDILMTSQGDIREAINMANESHGTPLYIAARKGKLEIVQRLIDAGADVDHFVGPEATQATPLFAACHSGHREIVEFLLLRGAQLEVPDAKYGTARKAAEDGGQDEILRILDEWEQSGSSRVDRKTESGPQAGLTQKLEPQYETISAGTKGLPLPSVDTAVSTQAAGALTY
ncbi:hypothetical protein MMC18_001764 [Xylographa bjoerkii]|nr:hypothetical protein [Xylographa bjoerkii]